MKEKDAQNLITLDTLLKQEEVITTETVHKIIKENFGVDYSYKQVRIIVKSLGYSYSPKKDVVLTALLVTFL